MGGYDGATGKPLMSATAELRFWGPVTIRAGAQYNTTRDIMRPIVGARAQVLREEVHGLDGAVAVFYRPEGFTEPEGEIETFVSLARHWSHILLVGNLVYGQDPEGRERDAEARLALLRRGRVNLGFDSRVRIALRAKTTSQQIAEPAFDVLARLGARSRGIGHIVDRIFIIGHLLVRRSRRRSSGTGASVRATGDTGNDASAVSRIRHLSAVASGNPIRGRRWRRRSRREAVVAR
jgi:hypothetical protein